MDSGINKLDIKNDRVQPQTAFIFNDKQIKLTGATLSFDANNVLRFNPTSISADNTLTAVTTTNAIDHQIYWLSNESAYNVIFTHDTSANMHTASKANKIIPPGGTMCLQVDGSDVREWPDTRRTMVWHQSGSWSCSSLNAYYTGW